MKKFVSLVLVLVLCMTAVSALAANPKSITNNGIPFIVTPGGIIDNFKIIITPDAPAALTEIEKLQAAESVAAYFEGIDVAGILGTEDVTVNEMAGIKCINYHGGEKTVTIETPSDYADGKVIVAIGVVSEGSVSWNAIEGEVSNNVITVTFGEEILNAMQNEPCIIAIVSAI